MSYPLVSIIMNCYNGQEYLKEAIDSVYAQTYSNWEIIFWDNASTDNTGAIAQAYDQRLHYHVSAQLLSLSEARNLAMQQARGKYLAFLDCDDKYFPEKLEAQVKLMEAKQCALSYSGAVIIDAHGRKIRTEKPRYSEQDNFVQQLARYEIMIVSAMVLRSILESEKIQFDTSLSYCADYHLFMRLVAKHSVAIIPKPMVYYRRHQNCLSNKVIHLHETEIRYVLDDLRKLYPDSCLKYPEAYSRAYKKLCIYRAKSLIAQGDLGAARAELIKGIAIDYRCFILYCMLLLPARLFIYLVRIFRLNIAISTSS